MSELQEKYASALREFGTRVHRIGAGQWGAATPCTDWDVRTLVNHVTVEQLWAPYVLAGRTIAEVGDRFDGDQLGQDPVATWDGASTGALEAFSADGALQRTVHLSYGDSTADAYCREMLSDLIVHSWDLARGIGADERLDEALVADVYTWTLPHADKLAATGLFAPQVPAPPEADQQTTMLAMFGRRA